MKGYEIVTTESNICFAISIGTVYGIERNNTIKLYNMVYLPGKDKFLYNDNIHLPKEVVSHFESLDLSNLNSSYKERKEVFQTLESVGIQPIKKYQFLVNEYNKKKEEKKLIRQCIFTFSKKK